MLLEALEAAAEALELGVDGPELVRTQQVLDRLSAKLGAAYGEFDHAELWDLDAATSMTAWLRDQARMTRGDAARTVASARRLRGLPLTSVAALDGSLSAGQVKVILGNVTDRSAPLFAEHEEAMVPELVRSSLTETETAMRWWARRADSTLDDADPRPEPKARLHLSHTFAGRWALDGGARPTHR